MQISTITADDAQQLGRMIFNQYRDECVSFEDASQKMVEHLFNVFYTDDSPDFSLIRVFRTMKYNELPFDLKQSVQEPGNDYLVLTGSVGVEDAWCDRRRSQSRQTIRIGENMSPMFKSVFKDLGFSWSDSKFNAVVSGENLETMNMIRFFHIDDVSRSEQITDQDSFVQPYGIQSALAIGTQFVSDAAYVLIGFSNQAIERHAAETLIKMGPHLSTLLSYFDAKDNVWT